LKDGSKIVYDSLEVGSPVFNVVEGGNVPLVEGEYELEDGTIIMVDADGKISEVKPVETETPETEVEVEDEDLAEPMVDPNDEVTPIEPVIPTPEEKIASLEEAVILQQERIIQIESVLAELTTGFGAFRGDVTKLNEKVEVIAKAPSTPSVFEIVRSRDEKEMSVSEKRMKAFDSLKK
jgi:hypothetical protein